jgi:hypothetical protein
MAKENEKWLQRLVEGYKKNKPNLNSKPTSLLSEEQRNKINKRD